MRPPPLPKHILSILIFMSTCGEAKPTLINQLSSILPFGLAHGKLRTHFLLRKLRFVCHRMHLLHLLRTLSMSSLLNRFGPRQKHPGYSEALSNAVFKTPIAFSVQLKVSLQSNDNSKALSRLTRDFNRPTISTKVSQKHID